jgi:hypothetical protein
MEASETTPAPEPEQPAAAAPAEGERNPAVEQAPIATAHQDTVIGDPGFRDEQAAVASEGQPTHVDMPLRTSAPPPEMQSGTPLPEERAAAAAAPEAAAEAAEAPAPPAEPAEPASA